MKVILLLIIVLGIMSKTEHSEQMGDYYFSMRNIDSTAIDSAIAYYRKAAVNDDKLLYKLADAMDYRLTIFKGGCELKSFIDSIEAIYRDNIKPSIAYTLMILWGRYGQSCGITQAVRYRIPDNIRNYALWLVENDLSYHDYAALLALGRLHYMTPNIPLFLTWPSLNKSLYYLEMFMDSALDTMPALEYIKDTREKLGLE